MLHGRLLCALCLAIMLHGAARFRGWKCSDVIKLQAPAELHQLPSELKLSLQHRSAVIVSAFGLFSFVFYFRNYQVSLLFVIMIDYVPIPHICQMCLNRE